MSDIIKELKELSHPYTAFTDGTPRERDLGDALSRAVEFMEAQAERISELEAIIMKERDALINDIKILAELHATINGSPPKGRG